jgi:hypothetical protein
VFGIFVESWVLTIVLLVNFQDILSRQAPEPSQIIGGLWGPLIFRFLIDRNFTNWLRKKTHTPLGIPVTKNSESLTVCRLKTGPYFMTQKKSEEVPLGTRQESMHLHPESSSQR